MSNEIIDKDKYILGVGITMIELTYIPDVRLTLEQIKKFIHYLDVREQEELLIWLECEKDS